MRQNAKIIIAVIVTAVIVGGTVYFWQQKNNTPQNIAVNPIDSSQEFVPQEIIDQDIKISPAQNVSNQNIEEPIYPEVTNQKTKTSAELMKELIIKNYPTAVVENYKIFEEIKSPNSKKTAVLFGLDIKKTKECCLKPIGLFINNQGLLGTQYDILQGSLQQMYFENIKWNNDKSVSYNFVISDEGGKQVIQKTIVAE